MTLRKWVVGATISIVATLSTLLAAPAATAAPSQPTVPSLPVAPPEPKPVVGIPEPCVSAHPWPADQPLDEIVPAMEKSFGLTLTGEAWTQRRNRTLVRMVWQTFDAVNCTDYLKTVRARNKGNLVIHAGPVDGWAWGDWGLTHPGKLTFDFDKWQTAVSDDPGRLVRLIIHEVGHAYNVDRGERPAYWTQFERLAAREGHFSDYAGSNVTEIFSDVLGYYVARCAKDNPYDKGGQRAYYEFAKTVIFNDAEFGPEPGEPVECSAGGATRAESRRVAPPRVLPGWLAPIRTQA